MYPREGESLGTRLVELHIVHCTCTWHRPSAVVDNVFTAKCWHIAQHCDCKCFLGYFNIQCTCTCVHVRVRACYWYIVCAHSCSKITCIFCASWGGLEPRLMYMWFIDFNHVYNTCIHSRVYVCTCMYVAI